METRQSANGSEVSKEQVSRRGRIEKMPRPWWGVKRLKPSSKQVSKFRNEEFFGSRFLVVDEIWTTRSHHVGFGLSRISFSRLRIVTARLSNEEEEIAQLEFYIFHDRLSCNPREDTQPWPIHIAMISLENSWMIFNSGRAAMKRICNDTIIYCSCSRAERDWIHAAHDWIYAAWRSIWGKV